MLLQAASRKIWDGQHNVVYASAFQCVDNHDSADAKLEHCSDGAVPQASVADRSSWSDIQCTHLHMILL